jgi:hypothetical protein
LELLLLHHQNIRIFFSRQTPIKQYFYAAKIQIIGWWSNKHPPRAARTMLSGDSSSGYAYKAQLERQSSFVDIQTGEKRDDHVLDTAGAEAKNAVASTFGTPH